MNVAINAVTSFRTTELQNLKTLVLKKNQNYVTDITYLHNLILHVSSILQLLPKIRQIFGIKYQLV